MFGKREEAKEQKEPEPTPVEARSALLIAEDDGSLADAIAPVVDPRKLDRMSPAGAVAAQVRSAQVVIGVFLSPAQLTSVRDAVNAERERRKDGTPTFVIVLRNDQLTEFGKWFYDSAAADTIQGVRLLLATSPADIPSGLADRLDPVTDPNIIKMPNSPEIRDSGFKYLYAISPQLRRVVTLMRGFAENGINRVYMLGGPGTGKSTVAYYYFLARNKGNFVQVNLTAESTGDKAAMKSLLCGHVAGAFPGAATREGALSFARDGVCFLDESHGVTGVVMQVLMEVLDSGQYLPYGATAKRQLECSVIFASNRSWESLRSMIHLDEHARLAASLITIPDLAKRQEDLIAVMATTLAKFAGQCKTWRAPAGISPAAWQSIQGCRWRGNIRTLMRVLETACVSFATTADSRDLLDTPQVEQGLNLWEPADHQDHEMFVSF